MKKKKISVYIPCYNAEKTLDECIKSIKNQSLKPNEIILINDGSNDKSTNIAKKNKIKIINHKKNLGISVARNTALKYSKNELLAGIDSDCIADKDWLKNLETSLNKNKAVLVGGQINEEIKSLADLWRKTHLKQDWGEKEIKNPKFIAGNNFLSKKSKLKKIGGYNKRFKTNYEDVDISRRIKDNNEIIFFEPKAKVTHQAKDNVKTVLDRHWRHMLNDYPLPKNIFNKKLKIIINFYTMLKFWFKDSFKESRLILIDIRLFFHHTKKDLEYKE